MPPWMSIAIPATIAVLTITVNAVINLKVKFAPDAATALAGLKSLGWNIVRWTLNVVTVASLVSSVASSAPLTRLAVFQIALGVGAILFILTIQLLNQVTGLTSPMLQLLKRHSEMISQLERRQSPEQMK